MGLEHRLCGGICKIKESYSATLAIGTSVGSYRHMHVYQCLRVPSDIVETSLVFWIAAAAVALAIVLAGRRSRAHGNCHRG